MHQKLHCSLKRCISPSDRVPRSPALAYGIALEHKHSILQRPCAPRALSARHRALPGVMASATAERITFQNGNGEKLVGVLTLPEAHNAVLLQHGYTSSMDGFHLAAIAEGLAERGIGSLRFSHSGNGDSEGNFKFANYSAEVNEMEVAVEWLQQRGMTVIGLLGHSKGGTNIVLHAARHDADGLRYVNVCGRCWLATGINARFNDETLARLDEEGELELPHPVTGKPFTLTKADLQERLTTDMVAEAQKIQRSHVLTLHGTADTTIPCQNAEEFDRNIRHSSLIIVDGADHRFTKHADVVVERTVAFMEKAL